MTEKASIGGGTKSPLILTGTGPPGIPRGISGSLLGPTGAPGVMPAAQRARSWPQVLWRRLWRFETPLWLDGTIIAVTLIVIWAATHANLPPRERVVAAGLVSVLVLCVGVLLGNGKRRLILTREALTGALENIDQGILMIDADRRVPVMSRRAAELLSLPPGSAGRFDRFDEILQWQLQSGEFGPPDERDRVFDAFVRSGGLEITEASYTRMRPNGMIMEVRTRLLPAGGAVRTFTDVTARHRAEERIRYLALRDGLTSLVNRAAFNDALEEEIAGARAAGGRFAVMFVDLDRFKLVNDLRGHHVGDRLLVEVARRLAATAGDDDIVARIGGDEFAVLQRAPKQPVAAQGLARALVDGMTAPIDLDGEVMVMGASAGVAIYPDDGSTADELLCNADTALYRAKEDGRGIWRLFHPAMNIRQHERNALQQDLRRAVADDELRLYFQPICNGRTGRILGYEALLRWQHPTRGMIGPTEFIPLAEACGAIIPIGRWVLEQACAAAVRWPRELHLAVNLSPAQFRAPDLIDQVAGALAVSGLDGKRLYLEVTEGLLMESTEQIAATFLDLKQLGIRLALDDFGTGYASLAYLRRFAFDCVKIDRSFVAAIDEDDGLAIIRAIVTLGHDLRLEIVAEGVETEAQRVSLVELGCLRLQGYLLGRPEPAVPNTGVLG